MHKFSFMRNTICMQITCMVATVQAISQGLSMALVELQILFKRHEPKRKTFL